MSELISVIIVILVSGSLGLVTYINNPKSATNKIFSLFALSIIFWAVILFLSVQPFQSALMLFYIRLSMLAAIVMSTCVLFLSYVIPHETFRMKKTMYIPLLVLAVIGMAISMSPFMFTGLDINGSNVEPVTGPGMLAFLITGLGYSVSGIFVLLMKYIKSHGREKKQLLYVLIGITLMHILLIWANFVVVLVFKSSEYMNYGPLFTLTFLISAAYAIIRHRLLDVRAVVARAVSFTILTVLIAVIYGFTLFRLPLVLPVQYQITADIVAAVILAYTFVPLRRFVEHISDNIFHREPYSSEIFLENLGNIMRSTLEIDRVTKHVLEEIVETLQVEYAALALVSDHGKPSMYIYGHAPQISITENTLHNLISSSDYKLILFDELSDGPVKMLLRTMQIGVVLPLTVKSTHYGVVILGNKKSGNVFSNQDIDIFNILLPQLAIAIQNAKSYDEISKFNITLKEEVERQTESLKKVNEDLKHLDELKDEFVFIATHELKNPVTAMRGYLSMLNEGSFGAIPEPMHEAIQQLTVSNQQLVDLVNDLLQIARSEAKTLKVQAEPVNLKQIIDDILEADKPLAVQKNLVLTHEAPLPMVVTADAQRLKEVVQNLVSNAIKYSEKGTITVTHEIKSNEIVTIVRDQGIGMSEDDQKKLFTRFFRSDAVQVDGIPGTGLGLFIVKQMVEKMGGKIWVNSQLGLGSTFSFSLPRFG